MFGGITMKFIESLSRIRPVSVFISILLGVVLLFTNANPAIANSSRSTSVDNTVPSSKILEKAQDVLNAPPMNLEKTEEGTEGGGLNEIQGTTGKSKMNRSSDSIPAVVDQIEKVIDKTTK
jgi:hypothetical protein